MKNYFYLLSTCLCIGLGLVSCKKDDAPIKGDEQTQESFRANLNFEVNVNDEFPLIDADDMELNRDELKALIKVDREGSKFVSRFNEFGKNAEGKYDKTIPVLVELRLKNNPSMVWVAEATAQTISEKRLQIRQETISFRHLEQPNSLLTSDDISDDISNDELAFQARLTIGGTLDRDQKRIDFSAPKPIVVQAVDDSVDLSAYTGKIPYTSDWVDVKVKKNQKTNELDIEGQSRQNAQKEQEYIPFSLKPYGNFLRLSMKNLHNRGIKVTKLQFASNDVVAQGYLLLGKEDYIWQAARVGILSAETTVQQRSLPQGEHYLRAYLWVAPVSGEVREPNTTVLIDFKEEGDNFTDFRNVRIYQKWTRGNAPRSKSTPMNIEINKNVALQPIYYMSPNFIKGHPNNNDLRFATTNSTVLSGNPAPDAIPDYYNVAVVKTLTETGEHSGLSIAGQMWHMPTENEIKGVFPAYFGGKNELGDNAKGQIKSNDETIDLGAGSKQYKSYYFRPQSATAGGNNDVVYGLRFLDKDGNTTPYTAAFVYQRVGDWKQVHTSQERDAYLQISVRPIGTWGARERIDQNYLKNKIATHSYWAEGNEGDIVRRISPMGRGRGKGSIIGNGYMLLFWRAGKTGKASADDAYEVQNSTNQSYTFFASGGSGKLGNIVSTANTAEFPVFVFRNR